MRISKVQHYPSLTKKLKVGYGKKIISGISFNPLVIPSISCAWSCVYIILPKATPSFFRDFFFLICNVFVHNDKPRNTNSVVIYNHNIFTVVYHNIHNYKFSLKSQ